MPCRTTAVHMGVMPFRYYRTISELVRPAQAASTRRNRLASAVAAPDISTLRWRRLWNWPLSEMRGSAIICSRCSENSTPGRVVTAVR